MRSKKFKWICRFFPRKVLFSKGRSIRGVRFSNLEGDVLGEALSDLVEGKKTNESVLFVLESQCALESKSKCGDLQNFNGSKDLADKPLWQAVMPWENKSPDQHAESYMKDFIENRSHYIKYNSLNPDMKSLSQITVCRD